MLSMCVSALAVACADDVGPSEQASSSEEGGSSGTSPTTSTTATPTTTTEGSESSTSTGPGTSETGTTGDPDSSSSGGASSSESGEAEVAVTLRFAAAIDGEPFACGQSYAAAGSSAVEIEPRDLRMFVHDVRLVRADDDSEVPLVIEAVEPWQSEELALIDFEDATGACAEGGGNPETHTELTGTVPAGDYDGVVFTIGVPEALNHADPLFAPAPLGATSMTWGWLFGYLFMKVEVQQVVEEGTPGLGLMHLGSSGCDGNPGDGSVVCSLPNRADVRFTSFDHATDTIVLDIGTLFADTDLALDNQCHSFQELCGELFQRVGLDFATGAPEDGQVVFGVE